jgi:hypothetical protein
VDLSYFTLYYIERNEFIRTQLNPVKWLCYYERYDGQGRVGQRQSSRPY